MLPWFSTSLIVMGILSVQDIIHRYLMKKGYNAIDLVIYGLLPTMVCIGVYIYLKNIQLTKLTLQTSGWFIASGILSFYGFLLLRQAQILSPNIGYVSAIAYSSVLFTVVLTALLFKDRIDKYGFAGAMLVVAGIYLISISN